MDDEERKRLVDSAHKGEADAQCQLGILIEVEWASSTGEPNEIHGFDSVNAPAYWYRKAAEQGHSEAQYRLGTAYNYRDHWQGRRGIWEGAWKAVEWFEKAAAQGHPDAQFELGMIQEIALEATEMPYPELQTIEELERELADLSDFERELFDRALRVVEALDDLQTFVHYMEAMGTSIYWFEKAAIIGQPDAQFQLSLMYEYGKRVSRDAERALVWLKKAARHGHIEAQYCLGTKYMSGSETENPNFAYAYAWLAIAAERGNTSAKDELANLLRIMSPIEHAEGKDLARTLTQAVQVV